MNMLIYEFMNLCQGDRSFINVAVCRWSYASATMKAVELFEGEYIEMPISLRYENVKKWNIEMRDYKPYIILYV